MPGWIGAEVGRDEAELLVAALELGQAVTQVRRVAVLRQRRRAEEAVGVQPALLGDGVVDELRPGGDQVRLHPAHLQERPRADDLDVDVAIVHEIGVALARGAEGIVVEAGEARGQAPHGRVGGEHATDEGGAVVARRRDVTVDVEDLYTVVHAAIQSTPV